MFERYTEHARRSIFSARYEAIALQSDYIDTVLGISTTRVDLPLSQKSKRILAIADEESKTMHHRIIDSGHLVLGLLRLEDCLAAALLRENGIDYARYRDVVNRIGVGR